MDTDVEAARPWVAEANPDYLTLIDTQHQLSSLYNMVNVPQAVWIDEHGTIVRPTETGGSIDILREFDPEAGGFPADAMARSERAKSVYMEAVKDWAVNGSASPHLFDAQSARQHLPPMTEDQALAHVKFQLGQFLQEQGRGDEAAQCFADARKLHPDSWNIFRQTSPKLENGIAADSEFWQKVSDLGEKAYYQPIDMEGLDA